MKRHSLESKHQTKGVTEFLDYGTIFSCPFRENNIICWECLGVSYPVLLVTLPIRFFFVFLFRFCVWHSRGEQKCSNRYDGVQCEVTQSCTTSAITTNRIYKKNVVAFGENHKLIRFHNISAQQNAMAIFVWTCLGAVGMCSAAISS